MNVYSFFMPELVLNYCKLYCSLTTLIILCKMYSFPHSQVCGTSQCSVRVWWKNAKGFCLSPSADANACRGLRAHSQRHRQSKYTFQTVLKTILNKRCNWWNPLGFPTIYKIKSTDEIIVNCSKCLALSTPQLLMQKLQAISCFMWNTKISEQVPKL